jgi:voltage-dependent calcium channel L type alpha-1D
MKPKLKDPEIQNPLRKLLLKVVKSTVFETSIFVCITINIVFMAISWFLMPVDAETALENVNHCFTAIFTIEAIMKIISSGKLYFKIGWNIFDFVIIIGTYLQILLLNMFNTSFGAHITVLRVFRIGRVLRLVRKAKILNNIFKTLLVTIPSLANIGFLLFLLLIFYSILGMNLFGKVKIHGELNSYANF